MLEARADFRGLTAFLDAAKLHAGDLRPWFSGVVDPGLTRMWRGMFETAGAAGGEYWAPLRHATREKRRSKRGGNRGGVGRPLWDYGELRASLVSHNSPDSVHNVSARSYERGTQHPYAVWHQLGFTVHRWGSVIFHTPRVVRPRRMVPANLPDHLFRPWLDRLVDYVVEGRITR